MVPHGGLYHLLHPNRFPFDSVCGSGTTSFDHDDSLIDLPARFVGPWGPFEVGDEVKALFPVPIFLDIPDERLHDCTIVNKHIANDGVASYDIV